MEVKEYIALKLEPKTTMCASILYPNGQIKECVQSHLKTMIAELGDCIWEQIPKDESPLFWLTAYLGVVLIDYENQIYSEVVSKEQGEALEQLYRHQIIERKLKDIHYGNRIFHIQRHN